MQPLFINEIHIKYIKFSALYGLQFTSLGYVLRPEPKHNIFTDHYGVYIIGICAASGTSTQNLNKTESSLHHWDMCCVRN